MPVQGSNLDFINLLEGVNALQRDPQLQRRIGNGSFTAYALVAVVVASGGQAVLSDTTVAYTIAAPGMTFSNGAPLANSPGPTSVSVSSSAAVTVVYK